MHGFATVFEFDAVFPGNGNSVQRALMYLFFRSVVVTGVLPVARNTFNMKEQSVDCFVPPL